MKPEEPLNRSIASFANRGGGSSSSASSKRVADPRLVVWLRPQQFMHDIRLLLGGSWVVLSRVISRVTILITHIKGLRTPLVTTPEPPSRV